MSYDDALDKIEIWTQYCCENRLSKDKIRDVVTCTKVTKNQVTSYERLLTSQ